MNKASRLFDQICSKGLPNWYQALSELDDYEKVELRSHQNGFVKCILGNYPDGSRLRLHLWSKNIPSNIHNHRWDFRGVVLKGELEELVYLEDDRMSEPGEYALYHANRSNLVDAGRRLTIKLAAKTHLPNGSAYMRGASLLHAVTSPDSGSISLVASDPPRDARKAKVLLPIEELPRQIDENIHWMHRNEFLNLLQSRI